MLTPLFWFDCNKLFKQLYFNLETSRRANLREDRLLQEKYKECKKSYDLAILRHELEFQHEKAKQLDWLERKTKMDKDSSISEIESKKSDSKLPANTRKNYHGYISEPGSKYLKNQKDNKIKDSDIMNKQFALTDNWIREENLRIHEQKKICRRLLRKEKVRREKVRNMITSKNFDKHDWLDEILDYEPPKPEENNQISGKSSRSKSRNSKSRNSNSSRNNVNSRMAPSSSESPMILEEIEDELSGSDFDPAETKEEKRERSLNAIQDNFVRLFFKYDNKNDDQLETYVRSSASGYGNHSRNNLSRRTSLDSRLPPIFSREQSKDSLKKNGSASKSRRGLLSVSNLFSCSFSPKEQHVVRNINLLLF